MEAKHHLVPRFLLRRFARDGQLGLTDRGMRWRTLTSVERAARVGGFYTLGQEIPIAAEDEAEVERLAPLADILEEGPDGGHFLGPDSVEKLLSLVEGVSKPSIDRLVSGPWPPSTEDRMSVALFVAMQLTRGQLFREDVDGMIRATQQAMIERNPDHYRKRWREIKGDEGLGDPLPDAIEALNGLTLVQDNKLGLMLASSMKTVPWFLARSWRLLCIDDPNFVISDEPVAMWTRRDGPSAHGVSTADLIYVPVDARHCLQLAKAGSPLLPEARVDGTAKIRQANNTVAANAHRWIWFHPDCAVLDDLVVKETRGQFRVETVAQDHEGDTTREVIRMHRERIG